jgi:GH25 family lysozyme M1 (1,4-beta-N-acetylmuramidase)
LAAPVNDAKTEMCESVAMRHVVLAHLVLLIGCSASTGVDEESSEAPLTAAPFFAGDPANNAVFALDISFWQAPVAQSEMDCFWQSGVRHMVIGTQDEEITREQLAMSRDRGMTIDAYVYLYWNTSLTDQVKEAFRRVRGFSIGRMWLDIEESPAGRGWKTLMPLVQEAVDACKADKSGADCGIYTGPGFWKTYMNDMTSFASVPLWYAQYNGRKSLSNWPTEHFGGWMSPVAKQWAEQAICGYGADENVMQLVTTPEVIVDRTLPPDTKAPPPAPGGLYPTNGSIVPFDYVKLMSETIPRATKYQLALERWNGSAFVPYYTWSNANAFIKASPTIRNAVYRFRARATNAYGWGAWSAWSTFDYGTYVGPRPPT